MITVRVAASDRPGGGRQVVKPELEMFELFELVKSTPPKGVPTDSPRRLNCSLARGPVRLE